MSALQIFGFFELLLSVMSASLSLAVIRLHMAGDVLTYTVNNITSVCQRPSLLAQSRRLAPPFGGRHLWQ